MDDRWRISVLVAVTKHAFWLHKFDVGHEPELRVGADRRVRPHIMTARVGCSVGFRDDWRASNVQISDVVDALSLWMETNLKILGVGADRRVRPHKMTPHLGCSAGFRDDWRASNVRTSPTQNFWNPCQDVDLDVISTPPTHGFATPHHHSKTTHPTKPDTAADTMQTWLFSLLRRPAHASNAAVNNG
jgi:hypothetical protein